MERVVLRIYHMAELGKSLLLEPLGGVSVCSYCVVENYWEGLLERLNLVKMLNILQNLMLSKIKL